MYHIWQERIPSGSPHVWMLNGSELWRDEVWRKRSGPHPWPLPQCWGRGAAGPGSRTMLLPLSLSIGGKGGGGLGGLNVYHSCSRTAPDSPLVRRVGRRGGGKRLYAAVSR